MGSRTVLPFAVLGFLCRTCCPLQPGEGWRSYGDGEWDREAPSFFGEEDDVVLQASPISVEPREDVGRGKYCGGAAIVVVLPGASCCSSSCVQKGSSSVLRGKALSWRQGAGFSAGARVGVCVPHSPKD